MQTVKESISYFIRLFKRIFRTPAFISIFITDMITLIIKISVDGFSLRRCFPHASPLVIGSASICFVPMYFFIIVSMGFTKPPKAHFYPCYEGYFHLVTVEKSQGELNLLVNIYTALYSFLKVSPWNTIPDTPRMDKLNRRKGTVLSDNSPHTIR